MPTPNSIDLKAQTDSVPSTRRKWLHRVGWASVAATLGLGGTAVYALCVEPHWLEIVERDLPISKLPRHWHGKRLAHISDVHVGPQVSDDYLRRYTAGEIDLFDGRRLYISRGLGHTIQVRFNVRPEITLFRLVAATGRARLQG